MKRSWFWVLAGGVLTFALANDAWAGSPGDTPAKGRFSIELGITSKGLVLKVGVNAVTPDAPAPAIDAVCPNVMPAYVNSLLARMRSVLGERLRDPSEESGLDPLELNQSLRDRTIPLGLAELPTY
jgi:hypothetical protein